MDLNDAVHRVVEAARSLADLPPPGPGLLKDDVGFSAATDSPMRQYLADVAKYGVNGVPLEAHEMAARALGEHVRTQLAGFNIPKARQTISESVKLRGAPDKGYSYFPIRQGKAKVGKQQDGAYQFDGKLITIAPVYRRGGTPTMRLIAPTGLRMQSAGWATVDGEKVYAISFKPEEALTVASAISDEYPAMAAALRSNAATWARMASGVQGDSPATPEELIDRASEPAQATAPTSAATSPGTLNPKAGRVGDLGWVWSGGRDVDINLPRVISLKAGVPDLRNAGIPLQYSSTNSYHVTVDVADVPRVAAVLRAKKAPDAAAVLERLAQVWSAAGPAGQTEFQDAITLFRRIKWTLPKETVTEVEAALERGEIPQTIRDLAYVMERVQPGTRKADLGRYGAFETTTEGIAVALPRTINAWELQQKAGYLSYTKLGGTIPAIRIKPHKLPAALKLLATEPGTLPLDLALRIAFLTDDQAEVVRDNAHVLEILSTTPSPDQILDPEARRYVDDVIRRVRLAPGKSLWPYQQVGVAYLEAARGRGMIGDQPGLGKTPQALAFLSIDTSRTPALVVAPATVVQNWVSKAREFVPQYLAYAFGPKDVKSGFRPNTGDIVVVSYQMLQRYEDVFKSCGFRTVIFDESHKIKNKAAKQAMAAYDLSLGIQNVIELSGTPIPNSPDDLWMQLRMIDPNAFPKFKDFQARYGKVNKRVVRQGDTLYEYDDDRSETLQDELRDALRLVMVRRLKSDVMKDLPPVSRIPVDLKLTPEAWGAYKAIEDAMPAAAAASWRKRAVERAAIRTRARVRAADVDRLAHRAAATLRTPVNDLLRSLVERELVRTIAAEEAFVVNSEAPDIDEIANMVIFQLGRLRRAVGQVKVPQAAAWILEHLEEAGGKKQLVVVANYRDVVNSLVNAFREAGLTTATITGDMDKRARAAAIEEFMGGRAQIIVITKAAAEGIDLDATDEIVFVERYWTPAEEEQLGARINRPAKKRQKTFEYYLQAIGPDNEPTTDQRMAALVAEKRETSAALIRDDDAIDEARVKTTLKTAPYVQQITRSVSDEIKRSLGSAQARVAPGAVWRGYWTGDVREADTLDDLDSHKE